MQTGQFPHLGKAAPWSSRKHPRPNFHFPNVYKDTNWQTTGVNEKRITHLSTPLYFLSIPWSKCLRFRRQKKRRKWVRRDNAVNDAHDGAEMLLVFRRRKSLRCRQLEISGRYGGNLTADPEMDKYPNWPAMSYRSSNINILSLLLYWYLVLGFP